MCSELSIYHRDYSRLKAIGYFLRNWELKFNLTSQFILSIFSFSPQPPTHGRKEKGKEGREGERKEGRKSRKAKPILINVNLEKFGIENKL